MRIPRLHVATPIGPGAAVELGETAARHLRTVLRLRPGARLTLFDGRGGEWSAELVALAREQARARLLEHAAVEREPPLSVTLVLGVSRGERMDLAVQKAVELGAGAIHPVLTQRSVVRLEPARAERRRAHWQAIAVAACEQCGRNRVPLVASIRPLALWLQEEQGAGLRLTPDPGASRGLGQAAADAPGAVTLLIGPEGGLDEAERQLVGAAGFEAVRLGPRVLRTETAAIAALTAVLTLWGDLR